MPNINNNTVTDIPPIRIVVAESELSEISRIRSKIDPKFQSGIKIAEKYDDLLQLITAEEPQLLILGRIDRSNYFQICQECHKIWQNLPIFLFSRQPMVDDSFCRLTKKWGVTDVITKDSEKLNQLLQTLDRPKLQELSNQPLHNSTLQQPNNQPQLPSIVTGQIMLTGLTEIAAIANNFFGPLAQGNYWRKTHGHIVDEFPFILNWSADHFGKIGCNESILNAELTDEEIASLRIWVHLFVEECERIIVGFEKILQNSDISPPAEDLLRKVNSIKK